MTAEYVYMEYPKPQDDVSYPLQVHYCGICSLPTEYCEFSATPDKCLSWLQENLPEEFERMSSGLNAGDEEAKKRQSRGGKALPKKKKEVEPKISLSVAPRGKKKFVTVVQGISTYNIDLKEASKYFGQKLATGCSVTGNADEIVIQGDVKDQLFDLLTEKWPQIQEDSIVDLGEVKR